MRTVCTWRRSGVNRARRRLLPWRVPELPEVERAARRLRRAVVGRTVTAVTVAHASLRRRLPQRTANRVVGARIEGVERRGRHQLLRLHDGRALHVHFRMAGDWHIDRADCPPPPYARVWLELDNGTRVVLQDPRALSTLALLRAGATPLAALGPEATDPLFDGAALIAALARRRAAIKPALLDQRLVAGLGNIYAVEALWVARIDPRAPATSLTSVDAERLVRAMRVVLARASGGSRNAESSGRFAVYDREGKPCRRCGVAIDRIVQAGRSTYFCPACQGKPVRVSPSPRARRP